MDGGLLGLVKVTKVVEVVDTVLVVENVFTRLKFVVDLLVFFLGNSGGNYRELVLVIVNSGRSDIVKLLVGSV